MPNNQQSSFSQRSVGDGSGGAPPQAQNYEQMQKAAETISRLQEKIGAICAIADGVLEKYSSQLRAAASAEYGYLFTDQWGTIRDANVIAANYLGIKNYQFLIGTPLLVYVTQSSHKAFMNQLHQLRQSPANSTWLLTLQHKQGWSFPVEVLVTQVRDSQNQILGWHWRLEDLVQADEPSMPDKKFESNRLPK